MTDKGYSTSSMIAIFDEDGGGDVDFQEFVSGLSAFSSKGNKDEKLHFAFKVYDIDRDGYISNGELFIVLKMMVGSNLKDMQLQQVCHQAIHDKKRLPRLSSQRSLNLTRKKLTYAMHDRSWIRQSWKRISIAMERSASKNLRRWWKTPMFR